MDRTGYSEGFDPQGAALSCRRAVHVGNPAQADAVSAVIVVPGLCLGVAPEILSVSPAEMQQFWRGYAWGGVILTVLLLVELLLIAL